MAGETDEQKTDDSRWLHQLVSGRSYRTVDEMMQDLNGRASGKRCPVCDASTLINNVGDEWCSHVNCDWGIEEPANEKLSDCRCKRELGRKRRVRIAAMRETGRRGGSSAPASGSRCYSYEVYIATIVSLLA